jgi:2-polyprenyl-3-methyl-5-hydroxy-6-metoxy-1,4-benzoquinol methylase
MGFEWLTYNPGVFLKFHWLALDDAGPMADALGKYLPRFQSIADIGCGSGAFAAEFGRRGLRVGAWEFSFWGRWQARRQGVAVREWDVGRSSGPLAGAPFDVAMSLEVAEHIPPVLADAFVACLAATAGHTIVLTAAHPGQGGQGHINEQPKAYWIEKVQIHPWLFDAELSSQVAGALERSRASGWLAQNMMIFRRVTA